MPSQDGELIQRFIHHDPGAFDELFKKYQNSTYRFACYLAQNRDDADDLFQETWLRAVKYLPANSNIRDFRAWIITIVANLHRDKLRKKKIRRLFSFQRWSEQSNTHSNQFETNGHESHMMTTDESNQVDIGLALNKAIAALPIKQRRIFILKAIEGLKHSEISEMLNVPVGTIKSLFHRAIKNLQKELSEFRGE